MKRITLDTASAAVKKIVQSLPMESDGVELELQGQVVCTVVPPHGFTETNDAALMLERGRRLVRRARERNKGVPFQVIQREVREAVAEVRRRKS
jgi:hypothetical protein